METNSSKIIRGKEAQEIEQWCPPAVSEAGKSSADTEFQAHNPLPTAAELEAVQNQAYEEGFNQGKKAGFEYGHNEALAEGRKRMQENTERIEALLSTLDKPFARLDEQVEQEILSMVVSIARQLVRREVQADPNQIIGVVREALTALPAASRNVQLVLHPDDAELVRKIYALSESELNWHIIEDPVIGRGGCKVITDASQIDATLESRLAAIIAPLMAGQRADDKTGDVKA